MQIAKKIAYTNFYYNILGEIYGKSAKTLSVVSIIQLVFHSLNSGAIHRPQVYSGGR